MMRFLLRFEENAETIAIVIVAGLGFYVIGAHLSSVVEAIAWIR